MSRNYWRVRAWLVLVPVLALGVLFIACLAADEAACKVREALTVEQ